MDGVLMDHLEIAQVVTFAVSPPKLEEGVGVAVVLCDGEEVDERVIRDFATERMADFKVTHKVVLLDEIPKDATGKMQRIGMGERLGLLEPA